MFGISPDKLALSPSSVLQNIIQEKQLAARERERATSERLALKRIAQQEQAAKEQTRQFNVSQDSRGDMSDYQTWLKDNWGKMTPQQQAAEARKVAEENRKAEIYDREKTQAQGIDKFGQPTVQPTTQPIPQQVVAPTEQTPPQQGIMGLITPKQDEWKGVPYPMTETKFNPEGQDYDMTTATKAGIEPKDGHYPSLDPRTGMVLKARNHPTWDLMVEEEKKLGNKVVKRGNRYYSVKATSKTYTPPKDITSAFEANPNLNKEFQILHERTQKLTPAKEMALDNRAKSEILAENPNAKNLRTLQRKAKVRSATYRRQEESNRKKAVLDKIKAENLIREDLKPAKLTYAQKTKIKSIKTNLNQGSYLSKDVLRGKLKTNKIESLNDAIGYITFKGESPDKFTKELEKYRLKDNETLIKNNMRVYGKSRAEVIKAMKAQGLL